MEKMFLTHLTVFSPNVSCKANSLHETCSLTVSYSLGRTVSEMYLRSGKLYRGSK